MTPYEMQDKEGFRLCVDHQNAHRPGWLGLQNDDLGKADRNPSHEAELASGDGLMKIEDDCSNGGYLESIIKCKMTLKIHLSKIKVDNVGKKFAIKK